jgi:hypothetical protein
LVTESIELILFILDLGNFAASIMLNHDVSLIVASMRLGQSKLSITLIIYGSLIPIQQIEGAQEIGEGIILPILQIVRSQTLP